MRVLRLRRRARRGRSARDLGFTMLEVLITLLLLSIVILGLTALQVATIRQVTSSRRATEAMRLAQNVIERYRSIPFAQLPPAASSWATVKRIDGSDMTKVSIDGYKDGPYSAYQMVESASGVKIITIRVTWMEIVPGQAAAPGGTYQVSDVLMTMRRPL
jgi:prepilin-type N-terminal cleavage/methylation domain-containing protein